MKSLALLGAVIIGAFTIEGCAGDTGDNRDTIGVAAGVALPLRASSVVVDGCILDTWQRSTLGSPSARKVLAGGDVVFLCLVPMADGTIFPRDPAALAGLNQMATDLHGLGYQVHFAISFTDGTGQKYNGAQTRSWLSDPNWRANVIKTLADPIAPADGIELDFQDLPDDAGADVTQFVSALSAAYRPAKKVGIFLPPITRDNPPDVAGGDSIHRSEIAPFVDKMRVSTLDYSEPAPGPTIDPGWAVDCVRFALNYSPHVDISYPLYGNDFGPRGMRPVGYAEAIATGAPVNRGPTGAPWVSWVGFDGEKHTTWFDDSESTGFALGAWTEQVLPTNVGVTFYGLGAEDPHLWDRLAARMP
jgi:hypothetical protein